jgi:uncharacterized Rossmann fold enzyme
MNRRFVIWGIGNQGKDLFKLLGAEQVEAIIDNNPDLAGKTYEGKLITSFDEYCSNNKNRHFIIISMLAQDQIEMAIQALTDRSMYNYFIFAECLQEFRLYKNCVIPLSELPLNSNKEQANAIYGINLFGLLLYDYFKQEGCKSCFLIAQKDLNSLTFEQVKEYFPDINTKLLSEIDDSIDKLYLTVRTDEDFIIGQRRDYHIENVCDIFLKMDIHHNKAIEKFKNIHKGKRCFIVCTGPSLKFEDLDTLHANNEISISMNQIFRGFDKTQWRPDYYICSDRNVLKDYGDEIYDVELKNKFITSVYSSFWNKTSKDNIYSFLNINEYYNYQNNSDLPFLKDFSKGSYSGNTVTYHAIRLATYMNFSEIYLLGCDFNYSINSKDAGDHFISNYHNTNASVLKLPYKRVERAYIRAREYADSRDFKIYNATRGGKLEVFERVNFDRLFENKDDEK